jgi:hypothetical protein
VGGLRRGSGAKLRAGELNEGDTTTRAERGASASS